MLEPDRARETADINKRGKDRYTYAEIQMTEMTDRY